MDLGQTLNPLILRKLRGSSSPASPRAPVRVEQLRSSLAVLGWQSLYRGGVIGRSESGFTASAVCRDAPVAGPR